MRKTKKQVIIALVVGILLVCSIVPAFASSNLALTMDASSDRAGKTSITDVERGEEFFVQVRFTGNSDVEGETMLAGGVRISYDPALVEVNEFTGIGAGSGRMTTETATSHVMAGFAINDSTGFYDSDEGTTYTEGRLLLLKCTAKASIQNPADAVFSFITEGDPDKITIFYNSTGKEGNIPFTTSSLTVPIKIPNALAFSDSVGDTVTTDVATQDADGMITYGAESYDFDATVYDNECNPIVSPVISWSIMGDDTTGLTLDPETGYLTVNSNAAEGDYTITATATKTETDNTGLGVESVTASRVITLDKDDSIGTFLTLDVDKSELIIPADDDFTTAEAVLTPTLYDQYGVEMTGVTFGWETDPGSLPTGVSFDTDTGVVSVGNDAKEDITDFEEIAFTATYDDGDNESVSDSVTVTVKREESEATTIKIFDGSTEITEDTINIVSPTTDGDYTYTATVYDQYGAEMSEEAPVWSTSGTLAPVTHEDGELTVPAGAEASFTLTAASSTVATVTKAVTVTITRAAQSETSLVLYKGDDAITSDTVVIPPTGSRTYDYTAKLLDQYGSPMENQYTFTWSLESAPTGVSQDGGTVTIPSTVVGDADSFQLKASYGTFNASITLTARKIAVDWTAITAKPTMVYGTSNGNAFSAWSGTGTANATETLDGTFSVKDAGVIQGVGDQTVTVIFTVTTDGDYKDSKITKDYPVTITAATPTITWKTGADAYPASFVYTGSTLVAPTRSNVNIAGVTGGDVPSGELGFECYTLSGSTYTKITDLDNDAVNVGTYYVKGSIKEAGNYTAAESEGYRQVDITKASPTASNFGFTSPSDLVYDGNSKTATVEAKTDVKGMGTITVKYYKGSTELTAAPTDAGDYMVKIDVADGSNYSSINNLTDGEWEFTIQPKSLTDSSISVESIPDKVYTGSKITPTVTVKDDTTVLTLTDDYTVSYGDNLNAGDATGTVTINGAGNYSGSLNKTFKITRKSIADDSITVSSIADQVYKGSKIEPTVTVKDGDKTLTAATDYTLEYGENKNAADNGTVTITGCNNYNGQRVVNFVITPETLPGSISLNSADSYVAKATVTATLSDVPTEAAGSGTWAWTLNGQPAPSSGDSATYTIPENVTKDQKLKVSFTSNNTNYTGSISSEEVTIGLATLTFTNLTIDDSNGILVDNTLSVNKAGGPDQKNYQIVWYAADTKVGTGDTYTIKGTDRGKTITMKAVATDVTYTGTVTASNSVAIAATKPDTPKATLTAGDGKITVNLGQASDGGSPITGYTLTITGSDGVTTTVNLEADATSHVFDGLTNGEEYTVTVTATNNVGTSDTFSGTATPVKPADGDSTWRVTVKADADGEAEATAKQLKKASSLLVYANIDGEDVKLSMSAKLLDELDIEDELLVVIKPVDPNQLPAVGLGNGQMLSAYSVAVYVDGHQVKNFGQYDYQLVLPYQPEDDMDVSKLGMVYINDSGLASPVSGARYVLAREGVLASVNGTGFFLVAYDMDGVAQALFRDVPLSRWSADYIYYLAKLGIVDGIGNNLFDPTGNVTRAQFVKMLAGVAGVENISSYTGSSFGDVAVGSWYAPYVEWAYSNGVTAGVGEGKFAPNANITREDMSAMLHRFIVSNNYQLSAVNAPIIFTDAAQISAYAAEAVSALQQANIISGMGDGSFAPQLNTSREAAAKMLAVTHQQIQ